MKLTHDVITFKMCDKILEYWFSQKVDWHIERGLKVSSDGSPFINGKPISIQVYNNLNNQFKRTFNKEAKSGVFCISSRATNVLTAH